MKKLTLICIGFLSMSLTYAQDLSDALIYNPGEIQGSARFRALSGAFGALGGDISAININPASSVVFTTNYASFSLINSNFKNNTLYSNEKRDNSTSDFTLQQAGGVLVFDANNGTPWKKFSLGIAYDTSKNYESDWLASGKSSNSISEYFLENAQGLPFGEISAVDGETDTEAYEYIGSNFGYQNQQAFLGYQSFILESDPDNDTNYTTNISGSEFNQTYLYTSNGYNGKLAFNFGAQYNDNLYLGLNLNSHVLNYQKITSFSESNTTAGPVINNVDFNNTLTTRGAGFSLQIGGIYKATDNLRVGLTYSSPTWLSIEEETTQSIRTASNDGIPLEDESTFNSTSVNPNTINIFPKYTIQIPGKLSGSLAYVFNKQGLISFDYSRKDYSNTKFKPTSDSHFSNENRRINDNLKAASTFRVGSEYKIEKFSLRAGYRFEESPYQNGKTIGDLSGYSLGLGYNFGNIKLDFAFDQSKQTTEQQFYSSTRFDNKTAIDNINSNFILSLGFSF